MKGAKSSWSAASNQILRFHSGRGGGGLGSMVSYLLHRGLEPGLKAPVWWPEGLWPLS